MVRWSGGQVARWSGDQVRLPEVQEGWKLRELCCVVCDPGLQLGRLDIEDLLCSIAFSCTDPVILSDRWICTATTGTIYPKELLSEVFSRVFKSVTY